MVTQPDPRKGPVDRIPPRKTSGRKGRGRVGRLTVTHNLPEQTHTSRTEERLLNELGEVRRRNAEMAREYLEWQRFRHNRSRETMFR
jgi:hypothetical protein